MARNEPSRVKIARWILALTIAAIAVFLVDWGAVSEHFGLRNVFAFFAAQPIQFFGLFLVSWRFAILSQKRAKKLWLVFRAYVLSVGVHTLVPWRLTEFLKISYLRDKGGMPASSTMAALVLERLTDIWFLGLFLVLGMGALWIDVNTLFLALSLLSLFVGVLILPYLESHLLRFLEFLPGKRLRPLFKRTISEAATRVREPDFFLALVLSLCSWASSFVLVLLILKVLHGDAITFDQAFSVFSAMAVGRAIPGLPGGLGTYEAAIVLVMGYLGFPFSQSLATALTLHGSQLLVVTAVALVILATEGAGLRALIRDARKVVGNG